MVTYNPNKSAKYGNLMIFMSNAEVPYTYFSLPYSDKTENPVYFYVSDTDEKRHYLNNNLFKHANIRSRYRSMDQYFRSIPLMELLLDQNMTLVGTLKANSIGVRVEINDVKELKEKTNVFIGNDDNGKQKVLLPWIDMKKSGRGNILVLIIMHDCVLVTNDQRAKPEILIFYDQKSWIQNAKMDNDYICLLT